MQFEEQIRRVKELLGGSARVGARSAEIAATERLGVVLPAHVKQLVSAFNGSENSTPVDHGWVTFWPLRAWQGVAEEPAAVSASQRPEAILFADHSTAGSIGFPHTTSTTSGPYALQSQGSSAGAPGPENPAHTMQSFGLSDDRVVGHCDVGRAE